MDRIIEVKVAGNYLTKDNKNAGVQHEANVTSLRISFDAGWDTYAKKVTWWDAKGKNPVERTLTTNLLEDAAKSMRVYIVPIPGEPLAEAGMCTFVIDGYISGKRQRSVSDQLVVKEAPFIAQADQPVDPTPTQAEQLQAEIDSIQSTIHEAAVSAAAAKVSENNAKASETAAKASETAAKASETNAKASETAAKASETNAKASETAAKASETAASGSATAAATSATNAANSASAADDSANAAKASETAAAGSATSAANSAAASDTSADNAAASASAAASSKTAAAGSATAAQTAKSAAETARTGAEAAKNAIENMSVEAVTLAAGSSATVTKGTDSAGNVKLTYGIPTGPRGPQGERGPQGPAGSGTGDMTTSVYDPTGKAQDIFAYVDAKGGAFIATYGTTTSSEIDAAYQAGKAVFAVNASGLMLPMLGRISATEHMFGGSSGASSIQWMCSSNTWNQVALEMLTASELDSMPIQDSEYPVQSGGVYSAIQKVKKPIVTTAGDGAAFTATIDGITELTAGLEIIIIPHVSSTTFSPTLNVNDGKYWMIQNMTTPSALDLYGAVKVINGGTGATTAEDARTNLGAASAYHTHTAESVGALSNTGGAVNGDISGVGTLTASGLALRYSGNTIYTFYTDGTGRVKVTDGTNSYEVLDSVNFVNYALSKNPNGVEFSTTSTSGHGGYIDFHFNGDTGDYTARIIEQESGAISILGRLVVTDQAPDAVSVRNISAGTTDLTAGTSPLSTGRIYLVYE